MRWFFVLALTVAAIALNAVIIASKSTAVTFVLGLVSFNILVAALYAIWLGAYYPAFAALGFHIYGHAGIYLAVGIFGVRLGYIGLTTGCSSLMGAGGRAGTIEKLAKWAVENNACTPFSIFLALFGVFMAWPSLKLIHATTVWRSENRV